MTLPASVLTGVVTWDISDLAADGAGGLALEDLSGAAVTFVAAPAYLSDATSGKLILPKPIGPVALSAGQQELALTDTDAVNPQAWTWTMLTTLPGGLVLAPITFAFPASALTAGQARLVDLAPVASSGGVLTTRGPIGPRGPAGIEPQGTWAVGTTYATDDAVYYGGSSYWAVTGSTGVQPDTDDGTHWHLMALKGQPGDVSSVNGVAADGGGNVTLTAADVGAATSAQGAKADTAVQPGSLATVATTGAYSDLTGRPTLGTAAAAATGDFAASTKGGAEKSAAGSATTGTVTLDCSTASVFTVGPTGNITLAPSNVPASGTACTVTVLISMPATLYTVTMPSGAVWLGSTPTFVASKKAAVTMLTVDGGTSWLCSAGVQA